jgi:hypothetical protein
LFAIRKTLISNVGQDTVHVRDILIDCIRQWMAVLPSSQSFMFASPIDVFGEDLVADS